MKSSRANWPKALKRLVVTGVLLTAALVTFTCNVVVPRQGWSTRWGPLVPHETFPGDCGICHVPTRWDVLREDFSFDHARETGYLLQGSHSQAACLRCHNDKGPVQAYVARGCGGCHVDPHRSSLGMDCQRCHNQVDWRARGLVAEHARTRFPLIGIHAVTPCLSCHELADLGDYRRAPTACELCHQEDLVSARTPDHVANGWTNSCDRCHTPLGWGGSNFTHGFFPLTAGHAGLQCTQCHTGGNFGPLPTDCYSCHRGDYEGAPNHVTNSYSHDCTRCHNTTTWSGATFNHRFPLTGPHNVSCTTCHPGGNTTTFTCFACHEHSKARMDDKHSEERGYSYDSQACVRCHPNGRH